MPKLNFVKKARKDNPVVKKGEPYFWWKFAFGAKQYSAKTPARSRLTQSEFFGAIWSLEDGFVDGIDNCEDMKTAFSDFIDDLTTVMEETEAKIDNMPESLQSSPTGELLTERFEALEEWISEIESLDTDYDEEDGDEEDYCGEVYEEFTALFGSAG